MALDACKGTKMATNTKTLLGAALMSLSLIATAPAFADPQQRDDPRHDPQPPQHGAPGRPSQGTPPRQGQWPQQSPPPRADHHDAGHHGGHRAPPGVATGWIAPTAASWCATMPATACASRRAATNGARWMTATC